jgi:hypothetical protein
MLTFLFWNINGRPLQALAAQLAAEQDVDVLLLAECEATPEMVLRELNGRQGLRFSPPDPSSACQRIAVYSRFSERLLALERAPEEAGKYTFRRLEAPNQPPLLLGVVHLRSKLYQSPTSQAHATLGLRQAIERPERWLGDFRTVLVGDWNMGPFEEGMVSAAALHGVMTRRLANEVSRTVDGTEYRFFYNPMWGRLGDDTPGPPGTYYYRSAEHVAYFWHTFDQVLLRPSLLPFFHTEDLQVLQRVGTLPLLSRNGLPDRAVASDHLPLLFRLRL